MEIGFACSGSGGNSVHLFGHQENRKIDPLCSIGDGTIMRVMAIRQSQMLHKVTLAVAHLDRFDFIDTKYLCDIVAVHIKIGYHSELIKALSGHQDYQTYRRDFVHRRENTIN